MAVHSDSVIDTRLQNLFPDAYTKLTDMEEYCYNNSQQTFQYTQETPGVDDYQPFFQDLNDAILAWFNYSWPTGDIKDYIMSLYQLIVFNDLKGTGQNLIDNGVAAPDIFIMNSYIDNLMGYSIDYYDDIVEIEDETTPGTYYYEAPNLEADYTLVDEAPPADMNTMSSKESSITNSTSFEIYYMLFEENNLQSNLSKEVIYNKIFIDFEFKKYFNEFELDILLPDVNY